MKQALSIIILLILGLLTACTSIPEKTPLMPEEVTSNTSDTNNITNSESVQEIITPESINDSMTASEPKTDSNTDSNQSESIPIIETINTDCNPKIYTYINNLSESPTGFGFLTVNRTNLRYGFAYASNGMFLVDVTAKKNGPILNRLTIPAGVYTPKKAIRIDENNALRILDRTYARDNKIYHKETLTFELYNLSNGCDFPEFEEDPLIVLGCGQPTSGDCIGSRYDEYWIQITVRNNKETPFDTYLSIDGGERLMPLSTPEKSFGNVFSSYRIPPYTFEPGEHVLTVEVETDGGIFKKDYTLLVLPDDKVAVRKYTRAYICGTIDEGDFIRYYDDIDGGILLKHNYYPGNLTLNTGKCVSTTTGFVVCDDRESFSGLYDYKILRLNDARAKCIWLFNVSEDCKLKDTVEVGDSFEDRFGEEYELLQIYTTPKLVVFKIYDKKWVQYYPYDVSIEYSNPIMITEVTGDSVTVSHYSTSCYQR